jgi:hypothetical protein
MVTAGYDLARWAPNDVHDEDARARGHVADNEIRVGNRAPHELWAVGDRNVRAGVDEGNVVVQHSENDGDDSGALRRRERREGALRSFGQLVVAHGGTLSRYALRASGSPEKTVSPLSACASSAPSKPRAMSLPALALKASQVSTVTGSASTGGSSRGCAVAMPLKVACGQLGDENRVRVGVEAVPGGAASRLEGSW